MKNQIFVFFLTLLLFSCQEEVFLELRTVEPMPVIEAVWTDVGTMNFVKISKSRDFYEEEPNELIKDAIVFIQNLNTGLVIPFRYAEQANRYIPLNNVGGRKGDRYRLTVRWEDNEYQSEGVLLQPPRLDSIRYEFKDSRLFREEGYYITLYGDIPFTEDNNYRIRIVRNDTLLNNRNDYLLFDDTFGTSILNNGFELAGFPFRANDRVRLELFRLNRDAFDYLNQLVSLLFNDGGLFSPPPQNPTSNIRLVKGDKEALGYFKVSPVLIETVFIDPDLKMPD
ncbi:DUF4249 domain-containing protein [Cecembia calidifontis]|jgi:hypothetical protein|uniref:Uncharacterized protein DUF4249 n=1 Tax=Cecembia calidifontis TaxID=1187080 RepID=A0A4Q7PED8_9BACT|nr:DUF4249 domain-containing protein [Cecembia calidifontis]RZS97202.1 uncharacterized protein DUF4249 [Cecembia calidifontis]